MRRDRRLKKTDQAICHSLMELLTEKPFEKITVKEVAARADIERKTFYLHYDSLETVLAEIEQDLAGELADKLSQLTVATPANLLEALDRLMRQHQDFYRRVLNTSPNVFLNDDFQLILERSLAKYYLRRGAGQVAADYSATFLAAGIVQVYRRFLQSPQDKWTDVKRVLERMISNGDS